MAVCSDPVGVHIFYRLVRYPHRVFFRGFFRRLRDHGASQPRYSDLQSAFLECDTRFFRRDAAADPQSSRYGEFLFSPLSFVFAELS